MVQLKSEDWMFELKNEDTGLIKGREGGRFVIEFLKVFIVSITD